MVGELTRAIRRSRMLRSSGVVELERAAGRLAEDTRYAGRARRRREPSACHRGQGCGPDVPSHAARSAFILLVGHITRPQPTSLVELRSTHIGLAPWPIGHPL